MLWGGGTSSCRWQMSLPPTALPVSPPPLTLGIARTWISWNLLQVSRGGFWPPKYLWTNWWPKPKQKGQGCIGWGRRPLQAASGKKTGTLLWQPWPLPWRRGEKICADKEKQMKEEEAAVEAVRRLIQTIKVIVSLRTSKPCVKVRVIFPRRRTRRSLPIDSRSLVSKWWDDRLI